MLQSKKKKDIYVLPRDDCNETEDPKTAALRLLNEKAGISIDTIQKSIGTFEETNKKGRVTANHHFYEVQDITFLENWKNSDRQREWVRVDSV
jgi:predicted NUDIX family NTP pyrophosphohydrolase